MVNQAHSLPKISLVLAVFFILIYPMVSLAQDAGSTGDLDLVSEIEIRGNETVATSTILGQLRTKVGRPISSNLLSEDLKRLYGLGYFKDVRIEQDK